MSINEEENLQDKVRKKIEEERKYADKISKSMRDSKQVELKERSLFIEEIEDAKKELEEGLLFIQKFEEEPELLFKYAYKYFKSTRGMIYTIMNHWKSEDSYIKGHDFQLYLSLIANNHFQSWLQSKGISNNFRIEVRTPNSFPSIFAVYCEDVELLQFNLLKKWYGIRKKPFTEIEILERHEKEMVRLDKEIKEQEEKLNLSILRRDNPLKYYKGIRNYISWIFINKKKFHTTFNKFVDKDKNYLEHLEEQRERAIQYLPENILKSNRQNELINMVDLFFIELGYELNTNQGSLY